MFHAPSSTTGRFLPILEACAKSVTLSRQFQSQKSDETTIMLISPTRFPWSKEGSNGERKEGSKMEEAGEGGRALLRPVWKKKQWWSEKPPLSLSIRRSPFIERGNNRTTRNLEARINEESHSPPLREAQPSQSRSGGQSGFPSREAPPAAHAKKRTSPAVRSRRRRRRRQ